MNPIIPSSGCSGHSSRGLLNRKRIPNQRKNIPRQWKWRRPSMNTRKNVIARHWSPIRTISHNGLYHRRGRRRWRRYGVTMNYHGPDSDAICWLLCPVSCWSMNWIQFQRASLSLSLSEILQNVQWGLEWMRQWITQNLEESWKNLWPISSQHPTENQQYLEINGAEFEQKSTSYIKEWSNHSPISNESAPPM